MQNYEELVKKSVAAIIEHQLHKVTEVYIYLPISQKTFYDYKLQESQEIKRALDDNKISIKAELRKNWRNGDNFGGQIALYKLLADEDELSRLNNKPFEKEQIEQEQITLTIGTAKKHSD